MQSFQSAYYGETLFSFKGWGPATPEGIRDVAMWLEFRRVLFRSSGRRKVQRLDTTHLMDPVRWWRNSPDPKQVRPCRPGGENHSGTKIPWPETAVRVDSRPGHKLTNWLSIGWLIIYPQCILWSPAKWSNEILPNNQTSILHILGKASFSCLKFFGKVFFIL